MFRRRRDQLILTAFLVFLVFIFKYFNDLQLDVSFNEKTISNKPQQCPHERMRDLTCQINRDVLTNLGLHQSQKPKPFVANINCKIDEADNQVYVPFHHIKSYFEISGDLRNDKFVWSHSYSRVFQHLKEDAYNTSGPFLQFANLNVENRPRVKCTNARDGVPISTQWDKNGYFYPTQICQYALAHWSKYKSKQSDDNHDMVIENGKECQADWNGELMRVSSEDCVHFEKKISLNLNKNVSTLNAFLGFDLKFEDNVTVTLSLKAGSSKFMVKYLPKDGLFLTKQGNVLSFGFGSVKQRSSLEEDHQIFEHQWRRFTRNLATDLMKGIGKKFYDKLFEKTSKTLLLEKVTFEGVGCITNLTVFQTTKANYRLFFHAADWLIDNQDLSTGGWPVKVTFNEKRFKYSRAKEVPPGWLSAMGQGHGISVLTRAYLATSDLHYLKAATKAIKPFDYPTFRFDNGPTGVSSKFLGQYVWYEEYPTEPSTFILNGFMYSLLGLYDFWKTSEQLPDYQEASARSKKMFDDGLKSLKKLLPLFDTGSGSVYDLRHFTMPGVEPKLARWDYHSLHVNLLFVLSTIDDDDEELLLVTAKRWQRYMYGVRAEHN